MAPTMREIEEQPANVEYANGQVAVLAANSSLSEIIRDVARRAGMAVKGDVIDERVFGTYGPAAPAEVLTQLLKGTGSNMMVLAGISHVPELILTPKQGEPTPPRAVPEVVEAEPTPEQAAPPKGTSENEQPVQASTDSDKAGLAQESISAGNSDRQADATATALDADSRNDQSPADSTAAQ